MFVPKLQKYIKEGRSDILLKLKKKSYPILSITGNIIRRSTDILPFKNIACPKTAISKTGGPTFFTKIVKKSSPILDCRHYLKIRTFYVNKKTVYCICSKTAKM